MYISDYNDNRIRKVTVSTGVITTVAGTGTQGYDGDGATLALLSGPLGVALDSTGDEYFISYFLFYLISGIKVTCTSLIKVITVSVR